MLHGLAAFLSRRVAAGSAMSPVPASTRLRILLTMACLPLVLPAARAEPSPPSQRIESFESTDLTGWTFDRDGVWSLRSGRLHAELPHQKHLRSFAYLGSETWTNYQVDVDVDGLRGVDKGIAVRVHGGQGVGVDVRGPGYNDVVMYRKLMRLGSAPVEQHNGRWLHLAVRVQGARYQVFVNGSLAIDYTDRRNSLPAGRIALAAYTGGVGECEVVYDNVRVTVLP